ncbi:carbohydrate kinase family protein [Cryptosporangium phraense]|uniref:carbohydrate kinase family protein n=1 Tax=Cryptosporangium phraense TaxID=2593070 RepID=UPI001478BA0D|nr:carbohydrate kinase family protein [Cryptosporangium phraense]
MSDVDIVGVGALNLDYRVSGPTTATLSALLGRPIDWGTETPVDAATIETVLRRFPARPTPGGSAYNAVAAVPPHLRVGYVGVAGRTPSGTPVEWFPAVDHPHVLHTDAALSGVCVAYTESGERTLLTHAGANVLMAGHLERSFEPIVAYLSAARFVHVTSFLDPGPPPVLVEVLRAVRAAGPTISVDPGHTWATHPTRSIDEILATADYVLVNESEFRALAGSTSPAEPEHRAAPEHWAAPEHLAAPEQPAAPEPDGVLAARVRVRAPAATIVLKRPDGIRTFGRHGTGHVPQTPLPPETIQDATGAGDAFAAGFLTALATGNPLHEAAARGLEMARRKLQSATRGARWTAEGRSLT